MPLSLSFAAERDDATGELVWVARCWNPNCRRDVIKPDEMGQHTAE
jgi:hypothetical protein